VKAFVKSILHGLGFALGWILMHRFVAWMAFCLLLVVAGCGEDHEGKTAGLSPNQQADANRVSACDGRYAPAPIIEYRKPIACDNGALCCVVNGKVSGFVVGDEDDRIVLPGNESLTAVKAPCDGAFPHEWEHWLRLQNGDPNWADHRDPHFCLCTETCCPTPGHPTGECS
jgi:hypothetical protein